MYKNLKIEHFFWNNTQKYKLFINILKNIKYYMYKIDDKLQT